MSEKHENEEQLENVSRENEQKNEDYEEVCFLCRRPESIAGKMIELPNNIHI